MPAAIAPRTCAVACAVLLAWTMKSATWRRRAASGVSTVSEFFARSASVRFWEARIASTLSVSRSAGFARWIAWFRSWPRPARAVPNSSMMSASRSRVGSRMMSLISSMSTGELVCDSGSRCSPLPSPCLIAGSTGAAELPGEHSANVSPISDCGRIVQCALAWNGVKPASSIRRTTAALLSGVTWSDSIDPTFAPATFTSSPGTARTKSKIARTL